MAYLLKMGGSFHGYVSHNQMVGDMILNWTVGTFCFFLRLVTVAFFLRVVFFVGRPVIVGSLGVTAGSFLVMFLQWQALSQSGGLEDFHEFPKKLGMSSSQVTPSFFRGVGRSWSTGWNHQQWQSAFSGIMAIWSQMPMFWGLRGGSAVQEPLTTYGVHNVIWPMGWWIDRWPLEALEVWNQKVRHILQMAPWGKLTFADVEHPWLPFRKMICIHGVNCKPLQEGPCWTSFSETLGYPIELVKPHICCFPCGVANPNFGWLNSNLWCRSAPASISSPASGLHADFCRPAHSAVWSPTINQQEASIFRGSWVKTSLKTDRHVGHLELQR